MPSISERSHPINCSEPGCRLSACAIAPSSGLLILRATAIAQYPESARRWTIPSPSPRLPPVTRTLRMRARELAAVGHREALHKRDRNRYFPFGLAVAAELDDLTLDFRFACVRVACVERVENHVGNHNRSRDRVLLRTHQRHSHVRMTIDHPFDFFRMDLHSA